MNYWKTIWVAYHKRATRKKLFSRMWSNSSTLDKFLLAIFFIFCVVAVIIHFTVPSASFLLLVVSEFGLLYKLDRMKSHLISNEFGDLTLSQQPPNAHHHQDSRYLLFKEELKRGSITKSHVNDCFDLLDYQIEIKANSNKVPKAFFTFGLGIITGIVATIWKKVDINMLMSVGVVAVITVVTIALLLTLFSSDEEKLREMKYFMMLYCKEVE